jgi:Protein of unknown function (DUF2796)
LKSLYLLWLALACAVASAGKAHEHGAARLDLAVDGKRVSITLAAPLDSLLGFEHAPRSDAQRRAVAELQGRLRDGGGLFAFDAAARCVSAEVTLEAPVLGIGATAKGQDEHAELDASWQFSCAAAPSSVEARLFQAFTRLRRLEVQVVAGPGQRKLVLARPAQRIAFTR